MGAAHNEGWDYCCSPLPLDNVNQKLILLHRVRAYHQRICRIPATTGLLFASLCRQVHIFGEVPHEAT